MASHRSRIACLDPGKYIHPCLDWLLVGAVYALGDVGVALHQDLAVIGVADGDFPPVSPLQLLLDIFAAEAQTAATAIRFQASVSDVTKWIAVEFWGIFRDAVTW